MKIMDKKSTQNLCKIHIILPGSPNQKSGDEASLKPAKKRVENIRNCDVFVDDYCLYIYADVELLKYQTEQEINVKEIKSLPLNYNAIERTLDVQIPCLPKSSESVPADNVTINKSTAEDVRLWKLKRITDRCHLVINNEIVQLEANFSYGFGSSYRGKPCCDENELSLVCREPRPHVVSPLQRTIDREVDELKNFSSDQYRYDFFELQVPEGHEDPMKYTFYYDDSEWNRDEELLLHNITMKSNPQEFQNIDTTEIDCGLLNILMAICYDIRSTSNEITCESSWTRSTLSAVLTYFEPFRSLKSAVISFLRRSIIYPLFRNYDLGRLCVEDTIKALQSPKNWILRQLIITHQLFATSDCSREVFNRYYIEDYIRYVNGINADHMEIMAQNLKNILFDVFKNSINLNLVQIETELLKELLTDCPIEFQIADDSDEHDNDDDDDDDEDEDEDDDDEDEDDDDDDDYDYEDEHDDDDEDVLKSDHSSSSDTETSVLEQVIALNI